MDPDLADAEQLPPDACPGAPRPHRRGRRRSAERRPVVPSTRRPGLLKVSRSWATECCCSSTACNGRVETIACGRPLARDAADGVEPLLEAEAEEVALALHLGLDPGSEPLGAGRPSRPTATRTSPPTRRAGCRAPGSPARRHPGGVGRAVIHLANPAGEGGEGGVENHEVDRHALQGGGEGQGAAGLRARTSSACSRVLSCTEPGARQPGGVETRVEAPEALHDGGHGAAHGGLVGHVGLDDHHLGARLCQRLHGADPASGAPFRLGGEDPFPAPALRANRCGRAARASRQPCAPGDRPARARGRRDRP